MEHFYSTKKFLYTCCGDLSGNAPPHRLSYLRPLNLQGMVLFGDLVKLLDVEPCWWKYITGDWL